MTSGGSGREVIGGKAAEEEGDGNEGDEGDEVGLDWNVKSEK